MREEYKRTYSDSNSARIVEFALALASNIIVCAVLAWECMLLGGL